MDVILKIKLQSDGTTKTMKFGLTEQVSEIMEQIAKKSSLDPSDYGLYDPAGKRWLKEEKILRFYNLKPNDQLDFKKKKQIYKIKLIDDSTRTILLDTTCPVSELISVVGKKIGLKNTDEFALRIDGAAEGQWLNDTQSLGEQAIDETAVITLGKKYFVNDANIDRDDPVQLHLVYVQSRDSVVSGKYPCKLEEAILFTALQCQIEQGNFQPGISKIVNLALVSSPQYRSNKSFLDLVYSEWKKLVGMTEVNAKLRYIQVVRALPTYGMTMYAVKERIPDTKKAMTVHLGFTRSHVLRLSEDFQQVLEQIPLEHVKRWANSETTFTLDFGLYRKEYYTVLTTEGDAIGKLLGGYIDILMKKRRDAGIVLKDENEEFAELEDISGLEGFTAGQFSSSSGKTQQGGRDENVDIDKARRDLERMITEFGRNAQMSSLTPGMNSFKEEVLAQVGKMMAALQELDGALPRGQPIGRQAMHQAAFNLVQHAEQLLLAAQSAMLSGEDPNGWLGDAARRVADALKDLLQCSKDLSMDPNNPDKRRAYDAAKEGLEAALANLQAVSRGVYDADGGKLISDLVKAVEADVEEEVNHANARNIAPAQAQALRDAKDRLVGIAKTAAATASDPTVKKFLVDAIDGVRRANADLMSSSVDPELAVLGRTLNDTLDMLLTSAHLPSTGAEKDQEELARAANAVKRDCAALSNSLGNAALIDSSLNSVKQNLPILVGTAKQIALTADKNTKDNMLVNAKRVVETTKLLTSLAAMALQDPDNEELAAKLRAAAEAVARAVADLVGDSSRQMAFKELVAQAKKAAAHSAGLIASSKRARRNVANQRVQQNLLDAAAGTSQALAGLLGALQDPYVIGARASIRFDPGAAGASQTGLRPNPRFMEVVDSFAPKAYKLVASGKSAVPSVVESDSKEALRFAADQAGTAIQDLIKANKSVKDSSGTAGIDTGIEKLVELERDLVSLLQVTQQGSLAPHPNPDEAREEALKNLNGTVRQVAVSAKQLPSVTQEDLGDALEQIFTHSKSLINVAREVASTTFDQPLQVELLSNVKTTLSSVIDESRAAKAASMSPSQQLNKQLALTSKAVVDSLQNIVSSAKAINEKELAERAESLGTGIEAIADNELSGVAAQIEAAMRQLLAVSAEHRANQNQMALDEQNLAGSILQACQTIAATTGQLIAAAAVCQRERGEQEKTNLYKADATWAEGLLSAAKAVAGSVTFLVTVANDAVRGDARDTQLRAAAQSVSVANAQLRAAAQAKGDPTRESYVRMTDASSNVTKATNQLTVAAKHAAQFEEERIASMRVESGHENKIARFQKEAEIQELEAKLRAARQELADKRKAAYAGSAPAPKASPEQTRPPTLPKKAPFPGKKAPPKAAPPPV